MLVTITYFRILIIPVRAMQCRVQRAGLVLLCSRTLPEDGTPAAETCSSLLFVMNCILLCAFCGYVLIIVITSTLTNTKLSGYFPQFLSAG